MRRHSQAYRHNPENGVQGDCFRTVLACLLDLERDAVPHFMADADKPAEEIWSDVDRWLAGRGLRYVSFPFLADDLGHFLYLQEQGAPGLRYALSGRTMRGTSHCVIVEGGEIVHNPQPAGGGIVGPMADGWYWMGFLLPTAFHGEVP